MKFRHELKYLINDGDHELLRERLCVIASTDSHAVNGEYKLRSLYFDTLNNQAFNEKNMGVFFRKKYRIRIYNDSDSVIKLECKMKNDSYINKRSASLTREEFDQIMEGNYEFLTLKKDNPLYIEFYYMCVSKYLRPRLIVDYEREPFIYAPGDVRITFDKHVRASSYIYDMFDSDIPCRYILEPGKMVMEVKFTEYLPDIIRDILPPRALECTALSKYALSFSAGSHLYAVSKYI